MPPEHSRPSPSSLHQSKRQRHTYGAGAARSLTHHEQQILQQAASILGTTPSGLPHHLPYALSSISAYEDIISTAEPAPMPLPSLHQYSGAFTDIPPAETWDFTERSVGLSDSSPPQGALADAQFVPTPHMGLAVSSNCFRLYDFMQLERASSLSVADLFSEDSSQVQQRYTFHMNMLQSSPGMDSDEFLDLRGAGEGLSIPPTHKIRSDVPEAGSNSNTETEVDRSSSGTLRSSPDAPPHLEAAAASTSNLDIAEIATPCLENAACPVLKTPRKRGPFKSEEEKRLTSFTRKLGACLRCRLQKIRCDPDLSNPKGSCNSCKGVEETALTRPFCTRARITDAKLYEKDSHPQFRWSRRWKEMDIRQEIKSWKSADIKTIQVTQDVGDLSYTLRVREFIPVAGDSLCRQWKTNGVQQSYPCAAYAIESMAAAGRQLVEFVANNIEASIDYYIDKSDWLMHQTYMEALKTSKTWKDKSERNLLQSVLKLWVSIRMESRSERICSKESLGMKPQSWDKEAANYGQILVPPVMSAQIELIATSAVLDPIRRTVLKYLRQLMERNRTEAWYIIYLCLFILLHSCALLTDFERRQARKYGLESRYVYDPLVQELHLGATILLQHFHYCNKGSFPLHMEWQSSPDVHLAELSDEQIEFIRKSFEYVNGKAAYFKRIRDKDDFEHPYYFLGQLYDSDWSPMRTI